MIDLTCSKLPRALRVSLAASLVTLICACAPQEEIQVKDAWLRPPAPSRDTAAAYMRITNTTFLDNVLIAVETSAADTVELHTTMVENEIMRMRPVKEISLPKQETVVMEPGGSHLMLFGLQRSLEDREPIYFTLFFKNQTTKIVKAEILNEAPPMSRLSDIIIKTDG